VLAKTFVADTGSFTRAAQVLQLPKAGVSQHVAGLDAHLGVQLLRRTTRQIGRCWPNAS
jgi:DNA-binding transcriptional LysR family regulator